MKLSLLVLLFALVTVNTARAEKPGPEDRVIDRTRDVIRYRVYQDGQVKYAEGEVTVIGYVTPQGGVRIYSEWSTKFPGREGTYYDGAYRDQTFRPERANGEVLTRDYNGGRSDFVRYPSTSTYYVPAPVVRETYVVPATTTYRYYYVR